MSGRLTVGPRPPHPGPRRVLLGADAWLLLAELLGGSPLPPPFRAEDGPPLDAAQRAAAEQALRDGGLAPGNAGDLLEDLHPALLASLGTQAQPDAVVDATVGLGEALRASRHALSGEVAGGLAREQRPTADGEIEVGPVELSTMLVDDVATEVLRGFGALDGRPDREPLQLDAAISIAAIHALAAERSDLARVVLERPDVPEPLQSLAAGLQAVARVDVAGTADVRVLVALRIDDGWWIVGLNGDDVLLRPAGEDEFVRELASALTGALTSGAPA